MTDTTTQVAAAGAVDARKIYGFGDNEVRALDGVTVHFEQGKFTAIMGPSGSGKSTLMHCLAGLDALSEGAVYIGDTYLASLNDRQLTQLRRTSVGFIFQAYNLVPTLNALEDFLVDLDVCLLIVSHDRFFLDKICTKLLVFEGEGRIKEWVGSYTELREVQKAHEAADQKAQSASVPVRTATEPKEKKPTTRMSFGEKRELQQLDEQVPALEKKKEDLLVRIAAGGTDHHAMMQHYIDLERTTKELDEKSERWLVLTEKAERESA